MIWEVLLARYEWRKHKMQTITDQSRQMMKATTWGGSETPIPPVASGDGTSPEIYFDSLNTGSAIINSVLQPQVKTWMFTDAPVAPPRKWIPASPPQPAPGFSGYTDPGLLDPRIVPSDEYVQGHTGYSHMHNNIWLALRQHLIWIVLFIVVGSILLEYGHWSLPHREVKA